MQLDRLHSSAGSLGVIYVTVVLSVYIIGVSIIIKKSGSEFRDLLKSLCPCLTRQGPMESYNRNRQRGEKNTGQPVRLSPPKVKVTLEEPTNKEEEACTITLVSYA